MASEYLIRKCASLSKLEMLKDWICVVDSDPISQRQKSVCMRDRPPLKGMIDCSDTDNAEAVVCNTVTHFPCFCHAPTNACVYGLRETAAAISELPSLLPPAAASTAASIAAQRLE